jgi:hypothetical protein
MIGPMRIASVDIDGAEPPSIGDGVFGKPGHRRDSRTEVYIFAFRPD